MTEFQKRTIISVIRGAISNIEHLNGIRNIEMKVTGKLKSSVLIIEALNEALHELEKIQCQQT